MIMIDNAFTILNTCNHAGIPIVNQLIMSELHVMHELPDLSGLSVAEKDALMPSGQVKWLQTRQAARFGLTPMWHAIDPGGWKTVDR
jgi:hypothetical protein